jgi:chloramphenicol-sensitive protein RarD
LVKKQLGLGALEGLAIETFISSFFYLAYLIYIGNQGTGQFGQDWGLTLLLMSAGAITAIPLLLFNGSTNRLPFTTIGLLQYITPTIQFSIGVWVLKEDMPTARWVGFLIIWVALVTLTLDLIKSSRAVNNSVA